MPDADDGLYDGSLAQNGPPGAPRRLDVLQLMPPTSEAPSPGNGQARLDSATAPAPPPLRPASHRRWSLLLAAMAGGVIAAGLAAFTSGGTPRFAWHGMSLPVRWDGPEVWVAAATAVAVLAALTVLWRAAREAARRWAPEDLLTVVAAVLATIAAMTGMWRFFGVVLHFPVPLRLLLFGFIDLATIVSALRARRNMQRDGTTGIDGLMMWTLTSLSAVLSSLDARSGAEVAFRLAAPLVAAWLWDRGLRLERRREHGRTIHWRITPERILVWAHIAEPTERTTGEVDAQRHISRLARAAKHLHDLQTTGSWNWRLRLARRRLNLATRRAVELAGLAAQPPQQQALLDQLGALHGAEGLATLQPQAPWTGLPAAQAATVSGGGGQAGNGQQGPGRDRRRRRRANFDRSVFGDLADLVSQAIHDDDGRQIHDLLADRQDLEAFIRWLGGNGGTKRLMILAGLYAVGDIQSRAPVQRLIAQLVPGRPGHVDKSDIRVMAAKVAQYWPGQPDAAGQPPVAGEPHDDPELEGASR